MRKNESVSIGKRALALVIALCMTLMMIPAVAFAVDDEDMGNDRAAYAVDVKSAGEPKSQTVDGDVNTDGGGVRAKSTGGGSATATVTGSVNAGDASFGVYVSGRSNGSQATATVGDVSAGAGVHVDASVGTATLNAGNVKATAEGAENIESNSFIASRGGTINANLGDVASAFTGLALSMGLYGGTISVEAGMVEAEGDGIVVSDGGGTASAKISDIFSGGTALQIENEGGHVGIAVDGDALSSNDHGLVYISLEGGDADVLVSGTLSGAKSGVVLGSGAPSLDLTVWKIESGSGPVIAGQGVDTLATAVNYIVRLEQLVEGGIIAAFKADGSALDKSHGYDVAREGDKVILKVDLDEGYELEGVYNGRGEMTPLAKDADGNYYVIVPRGGGIYLFALVEGGSEGLILVPTVESLVSLGADPTPAVAEDEDASDAHASVPLLTYGGVEINALRLKMEGQVPTLRLTLSNTNGFDIGFDCEKLRVVKAEDGSELAFRVRDENAAKAENADKSEVRTLAANSTGVELELVADEGACKAGDQVNVFYDGQLLGTFTIG